MHENKFFPEVKKNFGFGCMRLPMIGEAVDLAQFSKMIEDYFAAGFNYFDTAHGYIGGQSETAIRACLTSKYPRDRYILTDKLTEPYFKSEADIRPFFESQLAACGVDYFDFYLMHAQDANNYKKFQRCKAYETAFALKAEGKIRHVGLSFHDKAAVLDQILTDYPQIEVVQIQFNYVDYEDASVESRKVYEVCVKHNKPVIVMEPVKGGSLVNLPEDAKRVFDGMNDGSMSYASYAIRFAASFENMFMVLSGMSNREQMRDNISFMADFRSMSDAEFDAVARVCAIFNGQNLIPCTACRYCTDGCPKSILIPDLFACLNKKKQFKNWNQDYYYNQILTKGHGKASDCIKCGKCEKSCPQHLPIRQLLVDVAAEFEK
ncbi:MAG: aldo/keto reductase [Clostridia bacterium]|nr:aldo/keto reductase [Clostridia bacterium]